MLAPLIAHWSRIVRIVLGLLGLSTAVALIVIALPDLPEATRTLLVLAMAVAALVLAAAPWFIRVRRSLTTIREQKMVALQDASLAEHKRQRWIAQEVAWPIPRICRWKLI